MTAKYRSDIETSGNITTSGTLSAGNVGIGTTSPSAKLDVSGNIVLTGQNTADQYIRIGAGRSGNGYSFIDLQGDTTYANGLRLIRGNSGANSSGGIESRGTGSLYLTTWEAAPIVFNTSAAERMRISSNGNVGIGTTSVGGERLTVAGGNLIVRNTNVIPDVTIRSASDSGYYPSFLTFSRVGAGDTSTPNSSALGEIRFTGLDSSGSYMAPVILTGTMGVNASGGAGGTFRILTAPSGSTAVERFRITEAGTVGIGTSAPAYFLDVQSSGASSGLRISVGSGNAAATLLSVDQFGGGQKLVVLGNGNVGIGTSSPGSRLSVAGDIRIDITAGLLNGFTLWNGAGGFFGGLGTESWALGSGTSSNIAVKADASRSIIFYTNGTSERMRIDSAGRIQIPAGGIVEAPVSTNAQTGTAYTLVLADAGRVIEMNNAAANTVTVPLNSSVAFPVGTKIDIIQTGAGATSIAPTSGVTLNSDTNKRVINAQWAAVTLIKRATDTWVLVGALKA